MRGTVEATTSERDVRSRSLLEQHPDGVFEADLEGRFVTGNSALETLTGYSRDELVGMRFLALVHPDHVERATAEFERARQGESRTYDLVTLRRDGGVVTVNATNVPIVVDDEVVGVYGIVRDISEQCAASAALAVSEAQLRGVFDGAATGIAITTPEGVFVRANAAYCAMLGYSEAELVASPVGQIVHPDDRASNRAATRELLEGRRARFVSEKRYLAKNGNTVWVRASVSLVRGPTGAPVHLVANAEDITVRRRAEETVVRSESLLRIAGRAARIGGWAYELSSGKVFWSDEVHTITGVAPETAPVFEEVLEQFVPAARVRLVEAVEICRTAGTPYDLELELTALDGRRVWVRCVGEAERDAEGRIIGLRGAMQDVTAQRQAAEEIAQLASQLTTTMESITDALFTLDREWRFTYANPRAEQLLERDRKSLVGRNIWDEFPDAVGTRLYDAYYQAVAEQQTVIVDEFYYAPLDLWVDARAFPSSDGLTVYFRDISHRRQAEVEREALLAAERQARGAAQHAQRTITHQASHDPLTGLYNRRELLGRLDAAGAAGYTVLLLDLDGFKQVNDALGHAAGDELLLKVADLLRDAIRRNDILARVGGDEFAVLLPGHEPDMAERIAGRILEALRTPLEAAGQRLYVTASIGISRAYPANGGQAALRDADVAMYRAKDAGRDRSVWYDPMVQQQISQRLATAAELHDALESDQLLLHYQPAFDLTTGRAIGAEALVRWQHPERGLVPPGLFIPVAEETGLIEPLGSWCLAAALAAAHAWNAAGDPFTVWVNVAVHQLRRPGLAADIDRMLTEAGVQPHQLGIEITESALAGNLAIALAELEAISRLGVQIAIDDFGTGYSSLSRLGQLPIDILKIDRSFIANLGSPSGTATFAAIVDLAHAIGARVIAEGVETHEQLLALRRVGCDHVSGFLLARPDQPNQLLEGCATGSELIQTVVAADAHPTPARMRRPVRPTAVPLSRVTDSG